MFLHCTWTSSVNLVTSISVHQETGTYCMYVTDSILWLIHAHKWEAHDIWQHVNKPSKNLLWVNISVTMFGQMKLFKNVKFRFKVCVHIVLKKNSTDCQNWRIIILPPLNKSPPQHSALNQFNIIQSRQIQLPLTRLASTYTPVQYWSSEPAFHAVPLYTCFLFSKGWETIFTFMNLKS